MTLLAEDKRRRLTLSLSLYTSDLIEAWADYHGESVTSVAVQLIEHALLTRTTEGSVPEPVLAYAKKEATNRLAA